MKSLFVFALSSLIFCTAMAGTKVFQNAYISFEMLDTWNCDLEQSEWICRAQNPQESKEAVMILTAKERGPTDTFPLYEAHMNAPITTKTRTGASMVSRVIYKAQQNRYNDLAWLDGLHQDSELKNYFTRYLATVKDNIAILVTFSAHNKFYAKYSTAFTNTIKSLRVIAPKDLHSGLGNGQAGLGEHMGTNPQTGADVALLAEPDMATASQKSWMKNEKVLGLGILILAILSYVGYRFYTKRND